MSEGRKGIIHGVKALQFFLLFTVSPKSVVSRSLKVFFELVSCEKNVHEIQRRGNRPLLCAAPCSSSFQMRA